MKASLVVRTCGRPEAAIKILTELNKQTYRDFEVLLVCQGEEKDLEKIKSSTRSVYPIKYCYDTPPNAARARNVGIKEAAGEIIIFLDDDEKPSDNLIEAHIANYVDPAIGIVGGRVLGEKYQENVPDSKIGMVRFFDGYAYAGHHKNVRRNNVMHVKGGNMSVRRCVALEVGGFDERFEGSAEYEEFDFCLRVLKKGYRIVFDPIPVIEHFALPFGGCKVYTKTKEEAIYWLYRNHSLAFLNNFNKLFYPILIAEYIIRIIWHSFNWHNFRVIRSAFDGIRDGWKTHFSIPRKGIT